MEDIKKINIWKVLTYFIIYSIIGFFLETIYAIFTKGMLESRKSFLYGPFCSIYGIAAIMIIYCLKPYKKSPIKIFFLGMIIGLAIEYSFSFFGELIYHARWWDYSNNIGNINGRICVFYGIIWGILSVVLIYWITPYTEKKLDFLKYRIGIIAKITKFIVIITIIFLVFNSIITSIALKNFINNMCITYDIEIKDFIPNKFTENKFTKYFSDEKMIMNYPNISVITKDNKVLYLGSVLYEYKNYYYAFENIP